MSRADAARALAAFSELDDLAGPLIEGWPQGREGLHRIEWPKLRIVLDLFVAEAEEALASWTGRADAWFLDGFAPAKNPQMWRREVLELVARRAAPGARVASFTAAGAVRRGLEAQGFAMARRPGYGRKKESLHGRLSGGVTTSEPAIPAPRPLIIGAGVAGAALARAFSRIGPGAIVIDAEGRGAGASGNAAALMSPRLDAGGGPDAALFAACYARASQIYRAETPDAVISSGALELARTANDVARFARVLSQPFFDDGGLQRLDAAAAGARLQEAEGLEAIYMRDALVLDPRQILEAWAPEVKRADVVRLDQDGEAWVALDKSDREVGRSAIVCLAGGGRGRRLIPNLNLRALRGQATMAEGADCVGGPASFGAYAIPTRTGMLFGATHDRDREDGSPSHEDDQRNLETLKASRPRLAASLADIELSGRASVRVTTRDHLPVAGPLGPPGLFILSALGGRGFCTAPLLAEAVAAQALLAPSPLSEGALRRLAPGRRLLLQTPPPERPEPGA